MIRLKYKNLKIYKINIMKVIYGLQGRFTVLRIGTIINNLKVVRLKDKILFQVYYILISNIMR